MGKLKNIQIIDGAENATYSVYQSTKDEFASIFPMPGQDLELVEDFVSRVGELEASRTLAAIWERPIDKREAKGIQGTLYYDWQEKSHHLPISKREFDRDPEQLSAAQRVLYKRLRNSATPL